MSPSPLTDALGFAPAFATAAGFGLLALAAFAGWVREPRRSARLRDGGAAG